MARQRRAARARGFTLIELMVVVALIAIAVGVASLALRDGSQVRLEREAERLAVLLEGARAQARAGQLAVRWELSNGPNAEGTDFRFVNLPGDPRERIRELRWMTPGVTADIVGSPGGERAVLLGPEPLIGAQRIVLGLEDQRITLATDGLGPFAIATDAAR